MATGNHSGAPEGFKEVPGYAGKYFINQEGVIWGTARNKILRTYTGKGHGYPYIKAIKNGKPITTCVYYLMRLTWMAPSPGPIGIGKGLWCVNHKDGNKENSHIDNLEWVTCEENVRHAWRTGLCNPRHGESCSNAIFTSAEVTKIRARLLDGETVKDLATEYNVPTPTIKKIQWYICWKHQDHEMIDDMAKICSSKWIRVLKEKLIKGERMESCYKPKSRKF